MQFSATKEEIKQSAALVDMYERWKELKRANQQYVYSRVHLSTNDGKSVVQCTVLGCRNAVDTGDASQDAANEIEAMIASSVTKMAHDACEIIRKHMPIPLAK